MKTVNVFLASSEELELERDKFSALVLQLNDLFEQRGIQIKLKRWENLDASMGVLHKQEEYHQVLCNCEMTLVLFWKRFGDFTKAEFETAYEELKAGRNPKKIYLFFKDALPEELQDELRDFKFSFDSVYGHFYGKFSNVDTMRLQFLLQLELYLKYHEPLLTVKDGYVKIDNQKLVNLGNVPFAAHNKDYQRMQIEIDELEVEIAEEEQDCKENPQNEVKQSRLLRKRMKLEDTRNERDQHEQHLFETAKKVAKLSGQYCNQLTLQAIKLLEEGKVSEAVAVLDMKNLSLDTEHNLKNYHRSLEEIELWRKNIEADINAFLLRAESLQADLSIPGEDYYRAVSESLEKALQIAREINYSPEPLVGEILYPLARWYQHWNQLTKALPLYLESLSIFRELALQGSDIYLSGIIMVLNSLGVLKNDTGFFSDSEAYYKESLAICRDLASREPGRYLPCVAKTLINLGALQLSTGHFSESKASYEESLKIYRDMVSPYPDAYLPDVAAVLNNLGILYQETNHLAGAEESFTDSLAVYRELDFHKPGEYLSDIANTLNNLGIFQINTGRFSEAEASYTESLTIYRNLVSQEPDVYLPFLAKTLDILGCLQYNLGHFLEAEASRAEAYLLVERYPDSPVAQMLLFRTDI